MRNPVVALIWESWRLARRWYLWVLPLAFIIDLTLMSRAPRLAERGPPGFDSTAVVQVLIAPSAFLLNFTLAIFATMLAISIGSRSGFPLAFEYRLPVRTSMLVAVPMLTLAALCASIYVLPMLVCRLLFDVPFPLLPGGMLIGVLVFFLLACAWTTTSTPSRAVVMIIGIMVAGQLFALLDPVTMNPALNPSQRPGEIPHFNPEIVALTPLEYGVLAGVCLLLFALVAASIRKQRCGESATLSLPGSAPAQPRKSSFSLLALLERAPDFVNLPCPTTAPWRAEVWLELKRQVAPIVLLSILIALAIPVLFLLGLMPPRPPSADYLFAYAVFFSGIGLAIFNRRSANAGYMTPFEGTRGMSTLRLASIQVLAAAAGTLLGVVTVCISVYFSSPLLDRPGDLALRLQELVAARGEVAPLFMITEVTRQLVVYLGAVMLLACVHTWSVIYGRWIPYGAGIVAIYGVVFAVSIRTGNATLEDIKQHMWGFAITIFALTLLAFGKALHLKVLSLRTSLVALFLWGVFVACSIYSLAQQDIVLSRQASELQAFNAALLVLPFLLFVLLLWSYDRLRHR